MRDALAVCRVERREDLGGELQDAVERQWTFERLAFDQLHHEVIRTHIVECADVGVVQRGDRPRFTFEAITECCRGELDRDRSIEPRVAGPRHLPHAAGSNQADDLIGPDPRAWIQGHGAREDTTRSTSGVQVTSRVMTLPSTTGAVTSKSEARSPRPKACSPRASVPLN